MNILNILDEIEKVDGEIYERLNPRRKAMKDFFDMGKKVSLAAMPLALGSMFQKAYGQSNPANVNEVLSFALALEYLEYYYYNESLKTVPIPAGAARTAIEIIRTHERQHVDLLKGALGITGADGYGVADFDFTANNTFANVATNYNTFLQVALAFEDTGVRAYKGQAPILKGNPVLTTALRIHSVEARHAAQLRQMVAANVPGASGLKPWISINKNPAAGVVAGNDTNIAAVNDTYRGEDNTVQATIQVTGINGTQVTDLHAAECFDEFLTGMTVKNIANLFIKTGKKLT